MKWSDKLATGVAEIDEQHQALFQWFAQLESAAADQRMMTAAYALTRLSQYTRTHFTAEETLMARHAYPALEAHRAEHQAFSKKLQELQAVATTQDISAATIVLLREWLANHIMVSDMDYIPYAHGPSNVKGGPAN